MIAEIAALAVMGQSRIPIFYNGVLDEAGTPAYVVDGRTLVPLREVFDNLGAAVYWRAQDQTILAYRGEEEVVMQIGNPLARMNGDVYRLDEPPRIYRTNRGDMTMVPARFVAESLGAEVTYVARTHQVHIDTSPMSFYREVAPFRTNDEVLYLYRQNWIPARILTIYDYDNAEDIYKITYYDRDGRAVTSTVGRRFIKRTS